MYYSCLCFILTVTTKYLSSLFQFSKFLSFCYLKRYLNRYTVILMLLLLNGWLQSFILLFTVPIDVNDPFFLCLFLLCSNLDISNQFLWPFFPHSLNAKWKEGERQDTVVLLHVLFLIMLYFALIAALWFKFVIVSHVLTFHLSFMKHVHRVFMSHSVESFQYNLRSTCKSTYLLPEVILVLILIWK